MARTAHRTLIISAALWLAAAVALSPSVAEAKKGGTFSARQLTLLFSGSTVTATEYGATCVGRYETERTFKISPDGTFSVSTQCEGYSGEWIILDDDSGTWRVAGDWVCMAFRSRPDDDDECWAVKNTRLGFVALGPGGGVEWHLAISNPRYSSREALLAALDKTSGTAVAAARGDGGPVTKARRRMRAAGPGRMMRKGEAEAKQKALEAVKGRGSEELRRQREEQKRLMAQVARLTQEAEERRRAEEKRTAEEEARLKAEAERRRKAKAEQQRKAKVASRAPAPASDLQRQIAVLKQLTEDGLITGREFDFRKKGLLDRFVGAPKTATARLTAPKSPQAVLQAKLAKYRGINFGRYYALVIGNNEYKHLPNLKTAADDARAVADILRDTYGFDVTLLINATRADIIEALDDFREKLDDRTNLLIYYAGHGWLDEGADQGYWLPVDAKRNRRTHWVSNSTITGSLRALNSKHVMVVADSCYSGTLVRGIKIKENTPDYIRRMAGKRARLALTSGGLEPVADSGGGRHSPFAAAFIDVLKANTSVIDGTQLFSQMRRPVILNADQTPQYSDVRKAGHEGGDFLFVRRR